MSLVALFNSLLKYYLGLFVLFVFRTRYRTNKFYHLGIQMSMLIISYIMIFQVQFRVLKLTKMILRRLNTAFKRDT